MDNRVAELSKLLSDAGAIRTGEFTLKSGERSRIYADLRRLLDYPQALRSVADELSAMAVALRIEVVAGVPYGALPLAVMVAERLALPLVLIRREAKGHGDGRRLLGGERAGRRCLLVEDVLTTGASSAAAAEALRSEGFKVADLAVVVDRRGAEQTLPPALSGLRVHALARLSELLAAIEREDRGPVLSARKAAQAGAPERDGAVPARENAITAAVRERIRARESNLVVSLDVSRADELLELARRVAPEAVMIKVHTDIVGDANAGTWRALKRCADSYGVLLMEDRKFADIGSVVRRQYRDGPCRIAAWADLVTVHALPGPAILEALFGEEDGGAILIARMSSRGALSDDAYARRSVAVGSAYPHQVAGYVGHGRSREEVMHFHRMLPPGQLFLMPGVQLSSGGDALGQQYCSVEEAVAGGADALIVGRGIYGASDPQAAAREYRRRAVSALEAAPQIAGGIES